MPFSKDAKKIGFTVLYLLVAITLSAQSNRLDSLEKLSKSLRGKAQVDALNKFSFYLGTINIKRSQEEAKRAFQLSEQIQYDKGMAEALIYEAIAEYSTGNDPLSRSLFKRSIALSKRIHDQQLEGFGLAYLGLNYQNLDQLDSAIACYNQSLELLKDRKDLYYLSFLYLVMSDYYGIKGETDTKFTYLEKCWRLRENLKDKSYLPYIAKRVASYYADRGEYEIALSYLKKSQVALGKDTLNNEEISVIYQQRALIYAKQGYYVRALGLFYITKKYYEQNSFPLELTNLLLESGEVFEDLNNYETSLKNYFEALKISETNHYELERIKVLIRISWVQFFLEQYNQSRIYVEKAIQATTERKHLFEQAAAYNLMGLILDNQNRDNDAWDYYKRALAIRQSINDQTGIAGTTYNMGVLFQKQKNFKKAVELQLQSLSIEESLNHQMGMAYSYESLGQLYSTIHDFRKAEEYFNKAENVARKINAGAVLVNVYKYRRDLYRRQQNLNQALRYTELFENLRDSIYNQNLTNRISTLAYSFELEQKDNEIQLLTKSRLLQEDNLKLEKSRVRQQWFIIAAVASSVLFLGFIVVTLHKSNRKANLLNKEINDRNEEIQAQSEELTESNSLLSHLNKELLNQKEEIATQNEELIQTNEEVMSQRDLLASQNLKLEEARTLIEKQNETLESEVKKRTHELVEYNQQLEQFAFVSSHNLRAPVARILGLGQLLELPNKNAADETVIHKALIYTTRELDRVVRDLNTILEIKKNNTTVFTEINLEEELKLICISLEKEIAETKTEIITDFSRVPSIKTVRPYLDSILINLTSNAIKYRKSNREPVITLKSELRGEFICLTVTDNGLGIDLSLYREKLFTLYSRFHDHVEGKGLGLYLVKTQVNALGGKIEVESEVNKGTTFQVYLKNA